MSYRTFLISIAMAKPTIISPEMAKGMAQQEKIVIPPDHRLVMALEVTIPFIPTPGLKYTHRIKTPAGSKNFTHEVLEVEWVDYAAHVCCHVGRFMLQDKADLVPWMNAMGEDGWERYEPILEADSPEVSPIIGATGT